MVMNIFKKRKDNQNKIKPRGLGVENEKYSQL
jgi:hypothetical protein